MLIGRTSELAALLGHMDHGRPAAVIGAAGVGKTVLLRAAAKSRGIFTFEGGALNTLRWMPYLPLARAIGSRPPTGDHAAVAEWVANRVDRGVLILDDLQWADQDTLAVIRFLAKSIKLLVGIRVGDPGAGAALQRVQDNEFGQLRLTPLTREYANQFVRFWAPETHEQEVTRVVDASHGNPFLLRRLSKDGGRSPILRLALGARLRRLSPPARESISFVCVLGRPVEWDLLGTSAEELVEAGILVDYEGCLTPCHPLLVEAAIRQLDPEQRQAVHKRIAESTRDPGEAGRHFAAAGQDEDAYAKSIEAAAFTDDPAERAAHLAVAAASTSGPEGDRLRLQAAGALLTVGEYTRAEELVERISSDNPVMSAEAALRAGQARLWLGDPIGARKWIERGLGSIADTRLPVEVRLRIELGRAAVVQRDVETARIDAQEAWMLARAVGSDEAAARCLLGTTRLLDQSPACLDDFRAVLDDTRLTGDYVLECEAEAWLISALQIFGDTDAAAARAEWMVGHTQALYLHGWEVVFRFLRSRLDIMRQGGYERAIPELEDLLHTKALGPYREEAAALLALSLAHVGRETEARAQLAQSLSQPATAWARAYLTLAQAEIEWLNGRPRATLAAVGELEADLGAGGNAFLSIGSVLEGWALVDLGRYPDIPYTGAQTPATQAALVESEALVALGDENAHAQAEALFARAAELWSPNWLAGELRCRWAEAETARRSGDVGRAKTALTTLQDRAVSAGMVAFVARIQSSLRKLGTPLAADAAVPVRQARGDGLTHREREIMRLVGAGLSSRDIAKLLSIAQSTVETQIRSAMRKLGATTRVHAATLVWFRTEDALLGEVADDQRDQLVP